MNKTELLKYALAEWVVRQERLPSSCDAASSVL